jgi:predicted chitinase
MKKRNNTVNEVANPFSALSKLKNAYQSFKYGSALPKEIEAIKQARLATAIKQAELDAAKQALKQSKKLKQAEIDAVKAASKQAGKATVGREAGKASDEVSKGVLGKTKDIVTYPFRKPIKTTLGGVAAATGYEYLKDPKAPIGVLVGRGIDTAGEVASNVLDRAVEKGTEIAGDVISGYTGREPGSRTADADQAGDGKSQSALPQQTQPGGEETDSSGDWVRNPKSPRYDMPDTLKPYPPGSISYDDVRWSKEPQTAKEPPRLVPESFIAEQNLTDKELAQHFPDPNIRRAILAKAQQESGNKNVGEFSYAKNSNDYIRKVFKGNPHLAKVNDADLSRIKQSPEKFYDLVYGSLGGYKYRGRGPIQITGKDNYARIDRDLGLKGALVKDPDMLLRDPELAKAASIQYLKNSGLHKVTAKDQTDAAQRVIYSIGGPAYAPGSKRNNKVLTQITPYLNEPTKVAQNDTGVSPTKTKVAPGTDSKSPETRTGTATAAPDNKIAPDKKIVPPMAAVTDKSGTAVTDKSGPAVTNKSDSAVTDKSGPAVKDKSSPAAGDKTPADRVPQQAADTKTEPKKMASAGGIDLEKLEKARASGEDLYDFSKFLVKPGSPATVSEAKVLFKYQKFLMQEDNDLDSASRKYYGQREKKYGKTASELMTTSGGQFMTKADRLNQDKVDAALGAGKYRAGSAEANIALAKHFRQQADASAAQPNTSKNVDRDSGKAALPNTRPVPAAATVPQNLTPYSTAADVAGLTSLATAGASLTGKVAPKLATVAGKVLPGVNIAYQTADAARRATLGDYTGAGIAGVSAVPILAIPGTVAQAVRDKYRTGAFFPSDEEIKQGKSDGYYKSQGGYWKSQGSDYDSTYMPENASRNLKERKNIMNKKQQLKKKIGKLQETRRNLVQGLHDHALAEGKVDAAVRFANMLRSLGGGAEALPGTVIRKGGQTFDKIRGVDSELKYANRANAADIKSLDDIKNLTNKKPAVWRQGQAAAADVPAVSPAAAKAAAEISAKTGKPLSKTLSTLIGAAGGGLIGYGLASGDKDQAPLPTPTPTPTPTPPSPPAPRPENRPRPRPENRPRPRPENRPTPSTVDSITDTNIDQETPDTYWTNRSSTRPSTGTLFDIPAEPPRPSNRSIISDYETLLQRQQEKDRTVPQSVIDLMTKGKQDNLPYAADEEATRARDALKQSLAYQTQMKDIQNESLDRLKFLAGLKK